MATASAILPVYHTLTDMSGDVLPASITWDPCDDAGVARAYAAFAVIRAAQFLTYTEGPAGAEVIREFDPMAVRIVAVRQLKGG